MSLAGGLLLDRRSALQTTTSRAATCDSGPSSFPVCRLLDTRRVIPGSKVFRIKQGSREVQLNCGSLAVHGAPRRAGSFAINCLSYEDCSKWAFPMNLSVNVVYVISATSTGGKARTLPPINKTLTLAMVQEADFTLRGHADFPAPAIAAFVWVQSPPWRSVRASFCGGATPWRAKPWRRAWPWLVPG